MTACSQNPAVGSNGLYPKFEFMKKIMKVVFVTYLGFITHVAIASMITSGGEVSTLVASLMVAPLNVVIVWCGLDRVYAVK